MKLVNSGAKKLWLIKNLEWYDLGARVPKPYNCGPLIVPPYVSINQLLVSTCKHLQLTEASPSVH